jgi:hypothetical protein
MPVVVRHNDKLELSMVEYGGSVTMAELEALASFGARNVAHLKRDMISIVLPGADFASIPIAALDDLFERYRMLFAPLDFQIYRRSAWLCLSPVAQRHVDSWVTGRDTRTAMSSALRQFATFAEACDWLVLSEQEAAAVERGEGFVEVARFEPSRARTAV